MKEREREREREMGDGRERQLGVCYAHGHCSLDPVGLFMSVGRAMEPP